MQSRRPTEEQKMLSDTLRRFIAERCPVNEGAQLAESAPGYNAATWHEFAELGVLGALFEPEVGGYGGTALDIVTVFEALGRGAVAGPFLTTLVSGITLAGNRGEHDLLNAMIAGEKLTAFAHQEASARYDLSVVEATATRSDTSWSITGNKFLVDYGDAADYFIVSAFIRDGAAQASGFSHFLIPAGADGISITGYPGIDGSRRADLKLQEVTVPSASLLGEEDRALDLTERATAGGLLALCAYALGAVDVVKDSTAEYLRTRQQFGQPIGSFQALQHRMVTLLVEIEQARSSVVNAVRAFGESRIVRERSLAAAKYTLGRVGALVAEEAIQLHGGIGMTWDLPLSHYVKRLMMIDQIWGDVDHQIERYLALGKTA